MTITYSYDPDDVITRRMEKFVFGQWQSLSEMVAIGVLLFLLYALSQTVLHVVGGMFGGVAANPLTASILLWVGITLGLAGGYLVLIFVSRYRELVAQRELELGPYRQGPVKVALGAEGVSTRAPGQARQIAWASVRGLIDTPFGVALRLDERDFIPVPDDRLPDGMTRADLVAQIDGWRARGG